MIPSYWDITLTLTLSVKCDIINSEELTLLMGLRKGCALMEIGGVVLSIWILCLAVSVAFRRGDKFVNSSLRFFLSPFVAFWRKFGSYLVTLAIGVGVGVCYSQVIRQFLGI